jgi:hypothetical protein
MLKLSEKSRKLLKAIYRGLGATTISLAVSACCIERIPGNGPNMYGPGPDCFLEDVFVIGQIISKETGEPVSGIGIWIKDVTISHAVVTNSNGEFSFWLPKQDYHTVVFTDINGEEDGLFKQHTINWTWEEVKALEGKPLIVKMEEVNEE